MKMIEQHLRPLTGIAEFQQTLDAQPRERTMRRQTGSETDTASVPVPCVPLSDVQMRDYLDLMFEAESLLAAGRREDAERVKRVALDIARTGAPGWR